MVDNAALRMIAVARRDHDEWMAEYKRLTRMGNNTAAEACLIGANTVEQLIKRMQRELVA